MKHIFQWFEGFLRVKITKSLYLKNINPNELEYAFSQIVSRGLPCEKVRANSIFAFCTPIRSIYRKSLLRTHERIQRWERQQG